MYLCPILHKRKVPPTILVKKYERPLSIKKLRPLPSPPLCHGKSEGESAWATRQSPRRLLPTAPLRLVIEGILPLRLVAHFSIEIARVKRQGSVIRWRWHKRDFSIWALHFVFSSFSSLHVLENHSAIIPEFWSCMGFWAEGFVVLSRPFIVASRM